LLGNSLDIVRPFKYEKPKSLVGDLGL
jgi:hypothetical protein